MCNIKLVNPNDVDITLYTDIWYDHDRANYNTTLLQCFYGNTQFDINTEDLRLLVYDPLRSTDQFISDDENIGRALRQAIRTSDFNNVVTQINGKYHTRTSRSVVDVLNANWADIEQRVENIYAIENPQIRRTLRNEIINIIANGNGQSNRYSFATKICSFGWPDLFPIFDSIASTLLYSYLCVEYDIKKEYLGLYRYYLEAYDVFMRDFPQLGGYLPTDKFFWLYGKALSNLMNNTNIVRFSSVSYIPEDNNIPSFIEINNIQM